MTTDTITVSRDVFLAYQKAVALAREETERVQAELDTANAWAGQLSLASDLQRADIARLRAQLRQAADALRQAEHEAEAEREARQSAEADNAVLISAINKLMAFVAYGRFVSDADRELINVALSDMHPGAQLLTELEAAYHALMSYACGNSAPELAEEMAAIIGKRIGKARDE